jgi:hypothetical protein
VDLAEVPLFRGCLERSRRKRRRRDAPGRYLLLLLNRDPGASLRRAGQSGSAAGLKIPSLRLPVLRPSRCDPRNLHIGGEDLTAYPSRRRLGELSRHPLYDPAGLIGGLFVAERRDRDAPAGTTSSFGGLLLAFQCRIVPLQCRIQPIQRYTTSIHCRNVLVQCRSEPLQCRTVPFQRRSARALCHNVLRPGGDEGLQCRDDSLLPHREATQCRNVESRCDYVEGKVSQRFSSETGTSGSIPFCLDHGLRETLQCRNETVQGDLVAFAEADHRH